MYYFVCIICASVELVKKHLLPTMIYYIICLINLTEIFIFYIKKNICLINLTEIFIFYIKKNICLLIYNVYLPTTLSKRTSTA